MGEERLRLRICCQAAAIKHRDQPKRERPSTPQDCEMLLSAYHLRGRRRFCGHLRSKALEVLFLDLFPEKLTPVRANTAPFGFLMVERVLFLVLDSELHCHVEQLARASKIRV